MIHLIDTLLNHKCKPTAYVFIENPVIFCLAVHIDDPKDIWHIANLCRDQGFDLVDLGAPQYDNEAKLLYFPSLVLNDQTYDYLIDNP